MKTVDNPFGDIAKELRCQHLVDYVAKGDKKLVRKKMKPDREFKYDVPPAPYLGLKAKVLDEEIVGFENLKVLILSLNPGYNEDFAAKFKSNLINEPGYGDMEADELEMNSPGLGEYMFNPVHGDYTDNYWINHLKPIFDAAQVVNNKGEFTDIKRAKEIMNKIALVELIPYRSVKAPYKLLLTSTVNWVYKIFEVIKDDVVLVFTRRYDTKGESWKKALGNVLKRFPYKLKTSSSSNTKLTENNLLVIGKENSKEEAWDILLKALL